MQLEERPTGESRIMTLLPLRKRENPREEREKDRIAVEFPRDAAFGDRLHNFDVDRVA